jgi:mycothiol synthase
MEDLLWRPYQAADAPALAALMNTIQEHGGARPAYTADELQGLIATLVSDLDTDSSMVYTPGGALVAAGFTTTPPDGGFRLYLTGGVHPQWRGRGLGRRILGHHLARAREIHKANAPDVHWQADAPRTPADDEDAARLFRRFGFTPVRYWFEMVASPAGDATFPTPEGLRIQTYQPRHEQAVHAAHMESFANNWAFQYRDLPSWLTITVRSEGFLPELSLLAFSDRALAGYLLTYRHADPSRAYVGELGVRAPWRRRGLASSLLATALDAAAKAGRKEIALTVDADNPSSAVGLYQRVGFRFESRTATYSIPLVG